VEVLKEERMRGNLPDYCELRLGTLATLDSDEEFDSILYIDVLEHIYDDIGEIQAAAAHTAPHGHLIILAPAHPFLYSEFDAAIGHHRRYTRGMFADQYDGGIRAASVKYLDSAGLLVSLGNRLLLRSSQPSKRQLIFWDQVLIPISRITDRILQYQLGRSILIIYRKNPQE
jgi:2-polyprenyl-3-methyl-5-hydroxy-6-metoxy-1,4-benzoquinol methylase